MLMFAVRESSCDPRQAHCQIFTRDFDLYRSDELTVHGKLEVLVMLRRRFHNASDCKAYEGADREGDDGDFERNEEGEIEGPCHGISIGHSMWGRRRKNLWSRCGG